MPMTTATKHSQALALARASMGNAPWSDRARAIVHAVGAAWLRLLAWQSRRATRKILGSLDDRILHDIGLHRSEIESVLHDIDVALSRRRLRAIHPAAAAEHRSQRVRRRARTRYDAVAGHRPVPSV